MKNLTLLIAALFLSMAATAGDWTYNRLNRIYESDPWRCVDVSKRIMKRAPEKASPFYFASAIYNEKQKTHPTMKTRYMMMSKSLRYATKFEELGDLNIMSTVNWGAYVLKLRDDTDALMLDLDSSDLSYLADKLDRKCDHLLLLHKKVIIVEGADAALASSPAESEGNESIEHETPADHENAGYFGLATGNEVAPSANKIQEQKLLEMINEERRALFMKELKWNNDLARAARYHANDMAGQEYTMNESYDRVDGQLIFIADAQERISQFQRKNNVYQQDISAGTSSVENTFQKWIGSDDSYNKLFNEDNRSVGIGLVHDADSPYGYYWVIVLGEK
ncbi:MAG: CAP domain-containing protein [bacterium]|nr:CAP domain-containing protein [bacterium]